MSATILELPGMGCVSKCDLAECCWQLMSPKKAGGVDAYVSKLDQQQESELCRLEGDFEASSEEELMQAFAHKNISITKHGELQVKFAIKDGNTTRCEYQNFPIEEEEEAKEAAKSGKKRQREQCMTCARSLTSTHASDSQQQQQHNC